MTSFAAAIDDRTQIAEARTAARKLAWDMGFDETSAEQVAIVLTEAGTNLLKHAGGGRIFVRAIGSNSHTEIEVLALDKGPGIQSVDLSSRDGYSTSGTSGTGLGAIARLSRYCDIYSADGAGTALLARLCSTRTRDHVDTGHIGAIQAPKPGEDVCGDQWGFHMSGRERTVLLADGLGYGPDAANAAGAAVDILNRHPELPPGELLEAVHLALRSTRGAAAAIARLDEDRRIVMFAGLGNISGLICAAGEPARNMVSTNGTAGVEARHIREFTYPWAEGSLVILHSDGIGTHWNLNGYPGLSARDPALIAGVIYRDHSRGNDDATILVSK